MNGRNKKPGKADSPPRPPGEKGRRRPVRRQVRRRSPPPAGRHRSTSAAARAPAGDAPRQRESRYRFLAEKMNDILWTMDLALKITYVNPSIEKVLGLTRAQSLKLSLEEMLTPESLRIARARLEKELADDREEVRAGAIDPDYSIILVLDFLHRDGSVRVLESNLSFIRDRQGRPVEIFGLSRDITERKKTEENRSFLAQVLRCVDESVVVTDLDSRILYWGPGAERLYGYRQEEVLGRPYRQFAGSIYHRDEDSFREEILSRGVWRGEHPQRRRDGSVFWTLVEISVLRDGSGRPTGFIGVDIDITARKRAEEELAAAAEKSLRESEAWVALTADSAGAGLWSWNCADGEIWASEKTRALYGFAPDETITIGKFYGLLHPGDLARVKDTLDRVLREKKGGQIEYRVVLSDKSVRWLAVRAQAYSKPSGEPECLRGVSRDITDLRRDEEDRVQLIDGLAHLSRVLAMNELSTSLAHEINQPLGAILNNASTARLLMARGRDTREDLGEILEDIENDVKRAGEVVKKIRRMVKKRGMRYDPLSVSALVKAAVGLISSRLSIENVALRLDLSPGSGRIKGDRVQLQQVLLNLMTNALEAMNDTATRVLTISAATLSPDTVRVSVGDSGPGIAVEAAERLFEPFFTTREEGLGIGLPICKLIIEEHGGRIWGESGPGGATFSFTLKTCVDNEI